MKYITHALFLMSFIIGHSIHVSLEATQQSAEQEVIKGDLFIMPLILENLGHTQVAQRARTKLKNALGMNDITPEELLVRVWATDGKIDPYWDDISNWYCHGNPKIHTIEPFPQFLPLRLLDGKREILSNSLYGAKRLS
jgi:hypothetical protein